MKLKINHLLSELKEALLDNALHWQWQWLDRKINLWLNKEDCVKVVLLQEFYCYNDIISTLEGETPVAGQFYRCLGKQWYVKIKLRR